MLLLDGLSVLAIDGAGAVTMPCGGAVSILGDSESRVVDQ